MLKLIVWLYAIAIGIEFQLMTYLVSEGKIHTGYAFQEPRPRSEHWHVLLVVGPCNRRCGLSV